MITTSLRHREDGASAVEYGMLAAGVAALVILIVFALGGTVRDVFTGACSDIDDAASTSGDC